ncbi:methyltransferase [Nocardia sp. XZ_19_385]|uniref:methyltransferase n=1 Tax=Nocardia sp. XZ_19_385 TaxID=2769488 RepID=UPI00281654B4|nr:methyltransferase [Nocardia sp. XZ_19_385]
MTGNGHIDTEHNERLRTKIMAHIVSQAISAVCRLGVPDRLADGPKPVDALAEAVNAHPGALRRFLRVLAGEDLFVEVETDTFALTRLGSLLRTDEPGSLHHLVELMSGEAYGVWEGASHSLRTGKAAFPYIHGRPYFDWLSDHPDAARNFDQGQAQLAELRLLPLLSCDWSSVGSVVDVGGGNGTLLGRLLTLHPHLTGTVFDLPHVARAADPVLAEAGVSDRSSVAGGDFFSEIPAGADAYILSQILHDWPDDDAVRILGNCRDAMQSDARVLIVEQVLTGNAGSSAAALLDLHMLVLLGGQERTLPQWEGLLAAAGLQLESITPGPRSSVMCAHRSRK